MTHPDPDGRPTRTTDSALQHLRRRAQDRQAHTPALNSPPPSEALPKDAQQLLHELRVHQVELELQNEELRSAQAALELARERYFDLYDMAPVGYCTVNDADLILETNLTLSTLLAVPRGMLVKRALTRFMPITQQGNYRQCTELLRASGQSQSCELQMTRGDGSSIWVSLVANVTRSQDGSTVLRVMLRDVSERVRMDALLHDKNLELQRTRELADKANRAKSDFLASMSHELRSPLNAILGFAQLMDAGTPPPTAAQKSSIDQIIHGGWHLLALVNEILDLASIESAKSTLNMAPESLAEVLADCLTMIEPLATASAITLQFPRFDQPCQVLADRRRLKQVVINLLSNAIKYNQRQGHVVLSWRLSAPGRVRVTVQDSGIGLSSEQLSQLFEPFNRLGQENGTHEGTGIGLTVSKRLVEMMGGSIGASSTPGVGSIFWFELALANQEQMSL